MTDRIQSLTVVLDGDYRKDDDAQTIVNAIRMIKGVQDVELGPVVDFQDHMARQRVYHGVREALLSVLSLEGPTRNKR